VRFLGNRSSGKMGYAVAEEARDRGAEVLLVSGPTALTDPFGIETIRVETGEEMREVVILEASRCQVVILAAAVADFRTAAPEGQKIKRSGPVQLDLLPTADIAAETASAAPHAFRVGFALETEDLVTRARAKLERKGLALIVANELSATNAPFGSDRNRVTLVSAEDSRELPSMKKRDVATAVWDEIVARLPRQHPLN
jgi:phosphopantothenoylcysteine decarboxylase/phosphopantothenate--cysteine ligase